MVIYIDLVVLLNFLVDFLLILAVHRFCGGRPKYGRGILGAAVGGIYGGVCLIPGFIFLGGTVWRVVALAAVGCIAFGINRRAFYKAVIFLLFNMTLGGIVLLLNAGDFVSVCLCAGAIAAVSAYVSRSRGADKKLAAVEMRRGDSVRKLFALRDTGNRLCDPLTGQQVLIAGANIAREMLGLTAEQLRSPVETLTGLELSGARLVPYRTIDNATGMLLALTMDEVSIDGENVNRLVAFSPVDIGKGEEYEALTGGNL